MLESILLEDVSLTLGTRKILDRINLRIDLPSSIVILGPNGAGKTTLLKVLCGLLKPTAGSVKFRGLRKNHRSGLISRYVAYLPQDPNIDPRIPISAEEVVAIGRLARRGLGRGLTGRDHEIVESAMQTTGVLNLKARPYGHLSAGQRQRVALARALAQEARVMLLDEPLNNLDPDGQQEICATIDEIHRSHSVTIVLVTHFLERIPQTCEKAYFMNNGTIERVIEPIPKGEASLTTFYATLK